MKDYSSYTIDDFFADASFVEWVLNPHPGSLWQDVCLKNEHAEEAKQLILQIKFKKEANLDPKMQSTWQKIEHSISFEKAEAKKSKGVIHYLYMTAAIAASLIIGFMLFQPTSSFIRHDQVGSYAVEGSTFVLGSASSIEYDVTKWANERSVKLVGQASFDVKKGSPFSVMTEEGRVSVLGTQFNVDARDNHFYVIVEEGRVSVNSLLHEQLLNANQGYARNALLSQNFIDMFAPRKSFETTMHFQNTPLSQILAVLAWQKDVSIERSGLDELQRFTGFYTTDQDLDAILKIITWPLNLQYEINNASSARIFK